MHSVVWLWQEGQVKTLRHYLNVKWYALCLKNVTLSLNNCETSSDFNKIRHATSWVNMLQMFIIHSTMVAEMLLTQHAVMKQMTCNCSKWPPCAQIQPSKVFFCHWSLALSTALSWKPADMFINLCICSCRILHHSTNAVVNQIQVGVVGQPHDSQCTALFDVHNELVHCPAVRCELHQWYIWCLVGWFHKKHCVQPKLQMTIHTVTEWLNIGHAHRWRHAFWPWRKCTLNHFAFYVGTMVKIFSSVTKMKSTLCFGNLLSSCFTFLALSYCCNLLK